jgi:type VI protein secretion system component VasK
LPALKFLPTVLKASALTWVVSGRHFGFTLFVIIPIFLFWLATSTFQSRDNPSVRKELIWRAMIWLGSIVVIFVVHVHMHRFARAKAQTVADAISDYIKIQSKCPASLETVGQDTKKLSKELRLYFSCREGKPFLMYSSTYVPFESEHFNFEQAIWEHKD